MKESSSAFQSIALLQFSPVRSDPEQNLETIAGLLKRTGADVVVLPELCSTGYFFTDPDELRPMAETPDGGSLCSLVRKHASEQGCVLCAGFAERNRQQIYNSAILAFPDGRYHIYRKSHLFYRESDVFRPGDTGFSVHEWNGVRYGVMICYDWRFPESCRTLALLGCDVVLHPSNLVAPASLWRPTMQTRAIENRIVAATANRTGTERVEDEVLEFSGESQIVDCNGTALAIGSADGEEVVEAQVDISRCRNKAFNAYNDILRDRRPNLYLNEAP
jgi:predicted amidohydrolase